MTPLPSLLSSRRLVTVRGARLSMCSTNAVLGRAVSGYATGHCQPGGGGLPPFVAFRLGLCPAPIDDDEGEGEEEEEEEKAAAGGAGVRGGLLSSSSCRRRSDS